MQTSSPDRPVEAPRLSELYPTKMKTEFCGLTVFAEHTPDEHHADRWTFEVYLGKHLLGCDPRAWANCPSDAISSALGWACELVPQLIQLGDLLLLHKSEARS